MTEFQAPPGADAPALHDTVAAALRKAFNLGQTYWQQADSESYSQNAKSDITRGKFDALLDETTATVLAAAPSPVPASAVPERFVNGCNYGGRNCGRSACERECCAPRQEAAAPAEGDASQRLHEIGSWDHRGDALEDAVDEHYGAGSWAAILAAVKTGKPQPKGPAQLETVAYVCLSDDGIEANGLPGLSCGKRGEPVVWRADAEAAIRDAQAPAPAPKAAAPFDFDELRSRVIGAIHDHGSKQPEDDETWEEWHVAAFDLLGDAVRRIFEAAQPKAAPVRAPAVKAEDARDAARYRWLRDKANRDTRARAPMVFNAPGNGKPVQWTDALYESYLDEAMDAAMASHHPVQNKEGA
jgi:hypothetical protein